jgi:hypothetical protein
MQRMARRNYYPALRIATPCAPPGSPGGRDAKRSVLRFVSRRTERAIASRGGSMMRGLSGSDGSDGINIDPKLSGHAAPEVRLFVRKRF